MRDRIKQFPHCDPRVLHAPEDNCQFCNEHPLWQELRKAWGIAFTGHSYTEDNRLFIDEHGNVTWPCPAEASRGLKSINSWGGNIAATPERLKAQDEYFDNFQKEFFENLREKHPDMDFDDEIGGEG